MLYIGNNDLDTIFIRAYLFPGINMKFVCNYLLYIENQKAYQIIGNNLPTK